MIFSNFILAQKFSISTDLGVGFKNKHYASGFSSAIIFQTVLCSNNNLGISIGYSYLSSDYNMPQNLKESKLHFRDYTNITPINEAVNVWGWSKESFPPIKLRSQPNIYYSFHLGISYSCIVPKLDNLQMGCEALLSYNDQMEIYKVLHIEEIDFRLLGITNKNYNIPIFSYDTYLDIGFAPYIQYNLFKYKRLDIDIKTMVSIFPKSGEMIYNFSTVFTWKKPEGEKKNPKSGTRIRTRYK